MDNPHGISWWTYPVRPSAFILRHKTMHVRTFTCRLTIARMHGNPTLTVCLFVTTTVNGVDEYRGVLQPCHVFTVDLLITLSFWLCEFYASLVGLPVCWSVSSRSACLDKRKMTTPRLLPASLRPVCVHFLSFPGSWTSVFCSSSQLASLSKWCSICCFDLALDWTNYTARNISYCPQNRFT